MQPEKNLKIFTTQICTEFTIQKELHIELHINMHAECY